MRTLFYYVACRSLSSNQTYTGTSDRVAVAHNTNETVRDQMLPLWCNYTVGGVDKPRYRHRNNINIKNHLKKQRQKPYKKINMPFIDIFTTPSSDAIYYVRRGTATNDREELSLTVYN